MKYLDQKARFGSLTRKITLTIACAASLTACGGGDISQLKAQTINANPSFTIGQVFDHRNACDSVSWKERTDDRDRKIIEYRCTFKVDKSFYEKSQLAEIDRLNKTATQEQAGYEEDLVQRAKTLDDRQKQEAQMQSQLDQQSAAANPNALFLNQQIDRMKQDTATFANEYQQKKANEAQALAKIESDCQASIAKMKANGLVVSGTETFQWAVNDSGDTLIYAGFDIQTDNGRTSHQAYSGTVIDRALEAMMRNDAVDLPTYAAKVFVF